MIRWILAISLLVITNISWGYPLHPDDSKTPGNLCTSSHADFEEYRYDEQIPYCHRNVNKSKKTAVYESYGIPANCRHRYTIDHFLPLSIGGDNSFKNLWPEHKLVKAMHPNLEIQVYEQLRDGEITQKQAIQKIKSAKRKAAALVAEILRNYPRGCDDED